jgi:hypothetical protein
MFLCAMGGLDESSNERTWMIIMKSLATEPNPQKDADGHLLTRQPKP